MSDSPIWLDRFTKIAHCAFEVAMFKEFGYSVKLDRDFIGNGNEKNHFVVAPRDGFPLDPNGKRSEDQISSECGTHLAEACIAKGIKTTARLNVPSGHVESCVSVSPHSSIRVMRQYRITHDDYLYRFDVLGRA